MKTKPIMVKSSFPPQLPSIISPLEKGLPTPISESAVRHTLKEMCKIPHLINIIGGMSPFSFDSGGNLQLSKTGITWGVLIFQTVMQLLFLICVISAYDQISKLGEEQVASFKAHVINLDDNWVNIAAFQINTTSQCFLRLVYIFSPHGFVNFHRKLSDLSCALALDRLSGEQEGKTYLNQFKGIGTYMKKLAWKGMVTLGLSFVAMSAASYVSSDADVLKSLDLHPSPWEFAIYALMGLDFSLIQAAYSFHMAWFILYMKWMATGFSILSSKSRMILNKYGVGDRDQVDFRKLDEFMPAIKLLLAQVDQLEELVREFNSTFQLPIIFWVLTLTLGMTMTLFYSLTSLRMGLSRHAGAVMLAWVIQAATFAFFGGIGSSFSNDVQQKLETFCKNLSATLNAQTRPASASPAIAASHAHIMMLHKKLQNNPVTISPGNFFTLDRRMLTSVCGIITTYLIVLLQFKVADENTNGTQIGLISRNFTSPPSA